MVYTQFSRSSLQQASFRRAQLNGVWFQQCDLAGVWLGDTHLHEASFVRCDLTDCFVGGAVLADSDISDLADATGLRFGNSPAIVDWRTICRSLRTPNLERFLFQCGVPPVVITYLLECAQELDPRFLMNLLQSTFISYGSPDEAFAARLRDQLHRNGVKTFFFQTDAIPGQKLHEVMREGINSHDRVILICSRASLTRSGVRNEIQETLAREARDGGASYLIPITIDNFIFEWTDPIAVPIRDRVVADFRSPDPLELQTGDGRNVPVPPRDRFYPALQSLLKALRRHTKGA